MPHLQRACSSLACCSVLRPHPKAADARQGPSPTSQKPQASQNTPHNSIGSVALIMSAAPLSLEASRPAALGLGTNVQSIAPLRHCPGGKDRTVTLPMEVPVLENIPISQLQSRHFSLPQGTICHLAVGSVLLRAVAGNSLWAVSAGRAQPDAMGALIEMSGTIPKTLTPM